MNGWYLTLKTACSQSRLSIHANLISIVHLFIGLYIIRTTAQDHFNSFRMYLMNRPLMNMVLCLPMTKGFFSVLSVLGRSVEKMWKLNAWKYSMQTHQPWTHCLNRWKPEKPVSVQDSSLGPALPLDECPRKGGLFSV